MIGKFFINWFFLYPVIDRFNLWRGLVTLQRFARRGLFFGYISALMLICIAIGLVGVLEFPLRMFREFGMPVWVHVAAMLFYAVPFGGIVGLAMELFIVGLRAPDQPLVKNFFWSQKHQERWDANILWLEEQQHGA